MVRYVLGFAFSEDLERVVLIEKNRGPACNIGKLNGIGGKIELGETSPDAMEREFLEETGVLIPYFLWNPRGHFSGPGWQVEVFYVVTDLVAGVKTMEAEQVEILPRTLLGLGGYKLGSNVEMLMQLCLKQDIIGFQWEER